MIEYHSFGREIPKLNIAGLCKGSTTDSDSVCLGSNPSSAARKKDGKSSTCYLFFSYIRLAASYMHKCVICPSDVICASRVRSYKANIISLRNEVKQYHFC